MELLDKFGINFSVLLAQAVNFLIVLVVLYRFAYKPILKILHDRTRTIETSLKNAEKIHQQLGETTKEKDRILLDAQREASAMIEKAAGEGQRRQKELMDQTTRAMASLKEKTETELADAIAALLKNVQKEMAALVVQATEKLLNEKITPAKDGELISDAIPHLKPTARS
ncbi:MAG: F0F1 ATP synthase subunit B [Patescibacteria group bacterium]